jgi:hypothetical protein
MFPAMSGISSTFRSSGAMRNLLEVVLSINISSLRDEEAAPKNYVRKTRRDELATQTAHILLDRFSLLALVKPVLFSLYQQTQIRVSSALQKLFG